MTQERTQRRRIQKATRRKGRGLTFLSERATRICPVSTPILNIQTRRQSAGQTVGVTGKRWSWSKTRTDTIRLAKEAAQGHPTVPSYHQPSGKQLGNAKRPTMSPSRSRAEVLVAVPGREETPGLKYLTGDDRAVRPPIIWQPLLCTGAHRRPTVCQLAMARPPRGPSPSSSLMATVTLMRLWLSWRLAMISWPGLNPGTSLRREALHHTHVARGRCPVGRQIADASLVMKPETGMAIQAMIATKRSAPVVRNARTLSDLH